MSAASVSALVDTLGLRELFTPLPKASLSGTRTVQCGVKTLGVAGPVSIAGDKEEIQMLVEFVPAAEYQSLKTPAEYRFQ